MRFSGGLWELTMTKSAVTFVMTSMIALGVQASTNSPPVLPKVVAMLDSEVVEENRQLVPILENIMASPGLPDSDALFQAVVVSNESDALQQVCSHLQDGMVALMDMTSRPVAPLLRSLAGSAGIAYVSMVDNSYYRNKWGDTGVEWAVEPTSVQLLHVVADIARKESLNNVALVYDNSFDIQNTPRRILTNVPAQHLYVRMSQDAEETRRQVKMLTDIAIKSVFIIANNDNAMAFLEEINTQKGETDFNDIFVLTKERKISCPGCQKRMRMIVITTKSSSPQRDDFTAFMKTSAGAADFDVDDIKVDEALVYDVARMLVTSMPKVMTPISYAQCSKVTTARDSDRQQSKLLVDTLKNQTEEGVFGTVATREGRAGYDFTLMISERVEVNGDLEKQEQLGVWTERGGLNVSTSLTLANKRRHYRVVTVPDLPPFVYKFSSNNGTGKAHYDGYCIELLQALADKMDFDYDIYDSPDGQFGSMADDGTWTGVINELIQNRADIAVGPISVMAERENVVDFTVPYYDLVGLTILMKKPEFDYTLVKFLTVLDGGVWGCIIGAFFVFSFLICIFDRLSPFSYQNNRKEWKGEGQEPRVFSFKEGIWFCMMSLTPQGGGETPRALSGRLVAATWWLFGFIIIATYTANLAAFLTVSRLETKIESLEDLSKQFKIKYAPMNGSNAQMYFQRMADIETKFYNIWKDMSLRNDMEAVERAKLAVWDYPVSDKYTKLWNTMLTSTFPPDKAQAIRQVLTGTFAFISDTTTNKYATYTNCDLWEVGEEFSRKPYAIAVQEGSPLRSELSNVILQLINQRKLEEMKTSWWERDRKDCPDMENETDGISIRNIGGVFLVIVIGSALALVMLAMECYWYRYKPKQKKKLYAVSSRTTLTNAAMSSSSLASNPANNSHNHSNGVRFSDNFPPTDFSSGILRNGSLPDAYINDGFSLETTTTERL